MALADRSEARPLLALLAAVVLLSALGWCLHARLMVEVQLRVLPPRMFPLVDNAADLGLSVSLSNPMEPLDRDGLNTCLQIAVGDGDPVRREHARWRFMRQRGPWAVPTLKRLIADESPDVAAWAELMLREYYDTIPQQEQDCLVESIRVPQVRSTALRLAFLSRPWFLRYPEDASFPRIGSAADARYCVDSILRYLKYLKRSDPPEWRMTHVYWMRAGLRHPDPAVRAEFERGLESLGEKGEGK